MDWLTTLRRSGGINALARQIGSTPAEVATGVAALLPAVLGGMRHVSDRGGGGETGFQHVVDTLVDLGGGQLAADIMAPGPVEQSKGKALLAEVVGPPVAQRAVLAEGERNSGLSHETMVALLPALTMLVAGYITARVGGSGTAGSGGLSGLGSLGESLMNDEGGEDRI